MNLVQWHLSRECIFSLVNVDGIPRREAIAMIINGCNEIKGVKAILSGKQGGRTCNMVRGAVVRGRKEPYCKIVRFPRYILPLIL
jgi:hypothetical protein